jgi:hypothetical protein
MSDAFDLRFLLSDGVRAKLDRTQRLWLLRNCRIALVGSPDGSWSAQVGETGVRGPDFEGVIEQALRVLKDKPDLYPLAEAS